MPGKNKTPIILLCVSSFFTIVLGIVFVLKLVSYLDSRERLQSKDSESNTSSVLVENTLNPIDSSSPIEIWGNVKEGSLGELCADSSGLVINEENEVEFLIKSKLAGNPPITLYRNEHPVGEMKDEGNGVFSYKLSINSDNNIQHFSASADGEKSNELTTPAYEKPTAEDLKKSSDLFAQLDSVEASYAQTGYVSPDKYPEVIDDLYDTADNLSQKYGIGIEKISRDPCGITIRFDTGVTYAYVLKQKEVKDGDGVPALSVVTIEPYFSGENSFPSYSPEAQRIIDTIDRKSYITTYVDEEVTFANIKACFRPNSFIVWNGHGCLSEEKSYLITGVYSTSDNLDEYMDDLQMGKMIIINGGRLAINYMYFNELVGDLSNSLIYLGACYSGRDVKLLSTMNRKGASVAMAYTDSVQLGYEYSVYSELIDQLCSLCSDGKGYCTFQTAILNTLNTCGYDDGDDTPASPVWMGDGEYRLNGMSDISSGSDDVHLLAYLAGEEPDTDGNYISSLIDTSEELNPEYALFDMNNDGQNELLVRNYGSFIPAIVEYIDNKITVRRMENAMMSGLTIINSKNQYVGGDTGHVGRKEFWVSEIDAQGNEKPLLFFGQEFDGYDETKEPTFYKFVYPAGSSIEDDYTYEDWEKTTESEYESLFQEYTQENTGIEWHNLKDVIGKTSSDTDPVIEKYKEYINTNYSPAEGAVRIAFCYIDGDNIPEAVIEQEAEPGIAVTKLIDNKVIELTCLQGFSYSPKANEIIDDGSDGEYSWINHYRIDGIKMDLIDGVEYYKDDVTDKDYYYRVTDDMPNTQEIIEEGSLLISYDEYKSYIDALYARPHTNIQFDDGMYDTVEAAFNNLKE